MDAGAIKLLAEHRLGELLKETVNHEGGGHNKKHGNTMLPCSNGQLPDGISKLLAEHRLGELLAETVNHEGSRGKGPGRGKKRGNTMLPLSLPDGISKMQSSRYQKMATVGPETPVPVWWAYSLPMSSERG